MIYWRVCARVCLRAMLRHSHIYLFEVYIYIIIINHVYFPTISLLAWYTLGKYGYNEIFSYNNINLVRTKRLFLVTSYSQVLIIRVTQTPRYTDTLVIV